MEKLSDAERLRISRQMKKEKARQNSKSYYFKNRDKINIKRKEERQRKKASDPKPTDNINIPEETQLLRKKWREAKERQRKRKLEEEKEEKLTTEMRPTKKRVQKKRTPKRSKSTYAKPSDNRTVKHWAVRETKSRQPRSPSKRDEVRKSQVLDSSNTRASLENWNWNYQDPRWARGGSDWYSCPGRRERGPWKNQREKNKWFSAAVQVGLGYTLLGTQPKAKGVKVDRTLGTRGNLQQRASLTSHLTLVAGRI